MKGYLTEVKTNRSENKLVRVASQNLSQHFWYSDEIVYRFFFKVNLCVCPTLCPGFHHHASPTSRSLRLMWQVPAVVSLWLESAPECLAWYWSVFAECTVLHLHCPSPPSGMAVMDESTATPRACSHTWHLPPRRCRG